VDLLTTQTLDRVHQEYADERFGDMERLLNSALPLLQKRQKGDGSLARAYHTMSQIKGAKNQWKEALRNANKACEASQGNDQMLQNNMAQALYFRGWAQSRLGDSPVQSYNEALDIDTKIGPQTSMAQLIVWRKLAQYYESKKLIDQARACAASGIKLAEEGQFAEASQSRRLQELAFYYSVLGRVDDAINTANKGLKIEDCTLPRQDFRVTEELLDLARYYKEKDRSDLAESARVRAEAMKRRLNDFDQIFKPSSP